MHATTSHANWYNHGMQDERLSTFDTAFSTKDAKAFFRPLLGRLGKAQEIDSPRAIREHQRQLLGCSWEKLEICREVIPDRQNRLDQVDFEVDSLELYGTKPRRLVHMHVFVMISSPAGGSDGVVCEGTLDLWTTVNIEPVVSLMAVNLSYGDMERLFLLTEDPRAKKRLARRIAKSKPKGAG